MIHDNEDNPSPRDGQCWPHPAHCGVTLSPNYQENRVTVAALDLGGRIDKSYEAFPIPPVPEDLVSDSASGLRLLWRRATRCAGWALYLDMQSRQWRIAFPPQICAPANEFRCNLMYPDVEGPGMHWRLAGSFRSSASEDVEELRTTTPTRDGLHLVMHPARAWLAISAFVVIGGAPLHVEDPCILIVERARDFAYLSERVWLTDGGL
jgi:hypothetical protein